MRSRLILVLVLAGLIAGAPLSAQQSIRLFGTRANFPISTSIIQAAGLATATTATPHDLITGDLVTVSGATQTDYNGVVSVTVTSTTVFTYAVAAGTVSPATGTIVSKGPGAAMPISVTTSGVVNMVTR